MIIKHLFKTSNIIIFIAAILAIGFIETEKQEPDNITELQIVHRDIAIPNLTLTEELKAGMFLDGLRVDTSMIFPEDIVDRISPWEKYVIHYSSVYDVDPDLVRAIIYAESKGDPFVISRDGALGLMQIMPKTAHFMGIGNPLDPEENIKAGVKFISWLVKNSEKYDETHLLWAWNAGPTMRDKRIIPKETRKFIIEVLSVKTFLKEDRNRAI